MTKVGKPGCQNRPQVTDDSFLTFPDPDPDPDLGRLGEWTPPSLHLDWDPVEDLIAERKRYRDVERFTTMTKDISVQEMQEHFSDHIEEVRRGVTLRLIDGGALVAEISPAGEVPEITSTLTDDLVFRPATRSMRDIVLSPPLKTERDILEYLEEERADVDYLP
jgi:antitoxin (DNA-binding transcriptional repressor) of toxin-antitoxin stability system